MFTYYALLASAAVVLLVYRSITRYRDTRLAISEPNEKYNATPEREDPLKAYQHIEPLRDFEWAATPPMKLRPFKPKYHLTMGKKISINPRCDYVFNLLC
jgi:hypothetical protein